MLGRDGTQGTHKGDRYSEKGADRRRRQTGGAWARPLAGRASGGRAWALIAGRVCRVVYAPTPDHHGPPEKGATNAPHDSRLRLYANSRSYRNPLVLARVPSDQRTRRQPPAAIRELSQRIGAGAGAWLGRGSVRGGSGLRPLRVGAASLE